MSMPLAHYLKDFSAQVPSSPAPDLVGSDFGAPDLGSFDLDFPAAPEPEPVDVEAVRREAYAEGFEAATRELTEKFAAERLASDAANDEAISQLQTRLAEDSARLVADGLKKLSSDLALSVSEQAVAALVPFLETEVANKASADLADLLKAALAEGEAGTITVKGPKKLFDLLAGHMQEAAAGLRHVEAEDLDLSVDVAGTVLVTRISAFAASLKKVLG
ncbi:GTPase [Rhizobium sp. CAU 1783]